MRSFNLILSAIIVCLSSACNVDLPTDMVEDNHINEEISNNDSEERMTINIIVGSDVFKADIEDNETGYAFLAQLPLTLDMNELNGNEKYCFGVSLPRYDKRFDTIEAGDLMLYSGNCIVLFYGAAGGYNYTRIGKLQSVTGLESALGSGNITLKFEKE